MYIAIFNTEMWCITTITNTALEILKPVQYYVLKYIINYCA